MRKGEVYREIPRNNQADDAEWLRYHACLAARVHPLEPFVAVLPFPEQQRLVVVLHRPFRTELTDSLDRLPVHPDEKEHERREEEERTCEQEQQPPIPKI